MRRQRAMGQLCSQISSRDASSCARIQADSDQTRLLVVAHSLQRATENRYYKPPLKRGRRSRRAGGVAKCGNVELRETARASSGGRGKEREEEHSRRVRACGRAGEETDILMKPESRVDEGGGEGTRRLCESGRRGGRREGRNECVWGTNGTTGNGERERGWGHAIGAREEGKGGGGSERQRTPRGHRTGPRSRSRTGRAQPVDQHWSKESKRRRERPARGRTFPHATLALSEYSEMAIFSSTRWSAKLSGLHARARLAVSPCPGNEEDGERTRAPWRRQRRRSSACRGSSGGNPAGGRAWRRRRGLRRERGQGEHIAKKVGFDALILWHWLGRWSVMGFCGREAWSVGTSVRLVYEHGTHLDDLEELLRAVDGPDREAVQELDCASGR